MNCLSVQSSSIYTVEAGSRRFFPFVKDRGQSRETWRNTVSMCHCCVKFKPLSRIIQPAACLLRMQVGCTV